MGFSANGILWKIKHVDDVLSLVMQSKGFPPVTNKVGYPRNSRPQP